MRFKYSKRRRKVVDIPSAQTEVVFIAFLQLKNDHKLIFLMCFNHRISRSDSDSKCQSAWNAGTSARRAITFENTALSIREKGQNVMSVRKTFSNNVNLGAHKRKMHPKPCLFLVRYKNAQMECATCKRILRKIEKHMCAHPVK